MKDDRITQKYLRRYPDSKRTRSWAGSMVQIETEHGVWRVGGAGYTWAHYENAWVLPFEEAQKHVAHCGPEKRAAFIKTLGTSALNGRHTPDIHPTMQADATSTTPENSAKPLSELASDNDRH